MDESVDGSAGAGVNTPPKSTWLVSGRPDNSKGWSGAVWTHSEVEARSDAERLANDPEAWHETRYDPLPLPGNGPRWDAPPMFTASDPTTDRPTRSEQSLEGAAVNGLTPVGQEAASE